MIFLIEYDRRKGQLVELREFANSELAEAQASRLDKEIRLHRNDVEREVVLLEASSRDALLKTHGRYFKSIQELLEDLRTELKSRF